MSFERRESAASRRRREPGFRVDFRSEACDKRRMSKPGIGTRTATPEPGIAWIVLAGPETRHGLMHSNDMQMHGMLVDPSGTEVVRREAKERRR